MFLSNVCSWPYWLLAFFDHGCCSNVICACIRCYLGDTLGLIGGYEGRVWHRGGYECWIEFGFEQWIRGAVMVGLGSALNSGHGELQGLWGFIKMCVGVVHDWTWVSGMIQMVGMESYRGCGVSLRCVLWQFTIGLGYRCLLFSCDRLGLESVFVTVSCHLTQGN